MKPACVLLNNNVTTVRAALAVAEIAAVDSNRLRIPIEHLIKALAIAALDLRELIRRCLDGDAEAIRIAQRIAEP